MEHHLEVERLPLVDLGEVLDGDQQAELKDGEVCHLQGEGVLGLQHANNHHRHRHHHPSSSSPSSTLIVINIDRHQH